MTDQEINLALAELRGWRREYIHGNGMDRDVWTDGRLVAEEPPDHLNGVEALGHIHEAEKDLITTDRIEAYMNRLADVCPGYTRERFGYWPMVCARPRERAVAILRTVGKYRETAAK